MKTLARYFERRGVVGPWRLAGQRPSGLCGAVVIPALAESRDLPHTLASLAKNPPEDLARWLIVVVVNQTVGAVEKVAGDNQATLNSFRQKDWPGLHLAFVDAASPGLELPTEKGGVGMARKIGCDLAIPWLDAPDPILAFLDADTRVAANYLAAIEAHFSGDVPGAAVVPYCHLPGRTEAVDRAIRSYELYLRGHLFGLQWAGSPYAYTTIGSTMVCRVSSYVKIGGMNLRTAGEDFYFLQQLAKHDRVLPLAGTLVYPSARLSTRTPFGTGPTLNRVVRMGEKVTAIPCECYSILRHWLTLATGPEAISASELLQRAEQVSQDLGLFLRQARFATVWGRLSHQHSDARARNRAFHGWFDGLKSLRLLHFLLERGPGRLPPEESVADLLGLAGIDPGPAPEEQLRWLRMHQGVPPGAFPDPRLAGPAG